MLCAQAQQTSLESTNNKSSKGESTKNNPKLKLENIQIGEDHEDRSFGVEKC